MKRPFKKANPEQEPEPPETMQPKVTKKTTLADPNYNLKRLYKKGSNLMADEKLEDAIDVFEQALRIEPTDVESLLKLGYARFHLNDHAEALRVYDRVLDIDVANAEAWNLKGLIHYEQKNYAKALDATEKAIESDPNFGMAWYNKACFLSLLHQVPDAIESLKRSIEIDVKNARKAVKDKDFKNVRIEEGFKRIVEVVVLESIRQGYHTIGAIVWTTLLDKADAQDALLKLTEKGLLLRHEKREGFHRIPMYDLSPEIAHKVGKEKKGFLGLVKKKKLPVSVQNLKEFSQAIQNVKSLIEDEDADTGKILQEFDEFIDPKKSGQQMIEQFFEEHREIRLWKIRMEDRGKEFLLENKQKMLDMFDNIEAVVTKQLRNQVS